MWIVIAAGTLFLFGLLAHAEYPIWWTNRSVTVGGVGTNDYAAINQGQLKHAADQAQDELNEYLPLGCDSAISNLTDSFSSTNNYYGVNVGQLKYVAQPFYDRLIREGYTTGYPWTDATTDDADYEGANVGQLKYVFRFDLRTDGDGDDLADWWEEHFFGDTNTTTGAADDDSDGLDNTNEFFYGGSPTDTDSDDDLLPDGDEVNTYGATPRDTDSDDDGMGDGMEVRYGFDPTNAGTYAGLPFTEAFESGTVSTGPIHNQNDWLALPANVLTNNAEVETTTKHAGSQALELESPIYDWPMATNVAAYHYYGANGSNMVIVDYYAQPVHRDQAATPSISTNTSAAFYLNSNGCVVVYDGGSGWQTQTNVVSEGSWTRFTIRLDYSAKTWDLRLDSVPILEDLGFAYPMVEFSQFKARGSSFSSSFLDDLQITAEEPDDDADGLPNWWEGKYFGDATSAGAADDDDDDGLNNAEEYALGTSPIDSDTDDDGMGDGAEDTHGFDPTVADSYYAVPFEEDFELHAPWADIDGIRGWSVSVADTAVITSNTVHGGDQACNVQDADTPAVITHYFASDGEDVVWSDFYVQAVRRNVVGDPALSDPVTAALYVDFYGRLVVYDGTNGWKTETGHDRIPEGSWVRLSIGKHYTNETWEVRLDDVAVDSGLLFGSNSLPELSKLTITGPSERDAYMDDLAFTASQPDFDSDGDGLLDSWEIEQFEDLDEDATGDFDNDGITNALEYVYGSSAYTNDTDGDGLWDNAEVLTNKTDLLVADSDGDGANDHDDPNPTVADQNSNPGDLTVTVEDPEDGENILW